MFCTWPLIVALPTPSITMFLGIHLWAFQSISLSFQRSKATFFFCICILPVYIISACTAKIWVKHRRINRFGNKWNGFLTHLKQSWCEQKYMGWSEKRLLARRCGVYRDDGECKSIQRDGWMEVGYERLRCIWWMVGLLIIYPSFRLFSQLAYPVYSIVLGIQSYNQCQVNE